jgi:RNA polymerase sigma factor (sigma-70 family)
MNEEPKPNAAAGDQAPEGDVAAFDRLIAGLRAGDSAAEVRFWGQYGHALENLAEQYVHGAMLRRFGPDDVAQSACRTFLRRARLGQYDVADAASLWRLLCAIAMSKLREQVRFHRRQRRSMGQETPLTDGSDDDAPPRELADDAPTPAEAVLLAEQFQLLIGGLSQEEQEVVGFKLQDLSNEEIAHNLRCSDRTVRRILAQVRTRFESVLAECD